jgi:hypothetical protein
VHSRATRVVQRLSEPTPLTGSDLKLASLSKLCTAIFMGLAGGGGRSVDQFAAHLKRAHLLMRPNSTLHSLSNILTLTCSRSWKGWIASGSRRAFAWVTAFLLVQHSLLCTLAELLPRQP